VSDARDRVGAVLRDVLHEFDVQVAGRRVLLGIATGLVAGLAAAALFGATESIVEFIAAQFGQPATHDPAATGAALSGFARWGWASLALFGGLASAVLQRFLPEAGGGGTEPYLHAYHQAGGVLSPRAGVAKIFGSAAVVGTGGSAGLEAPAGYIGAAMSNLLTRPLQLTTSERRVLLVAGAAAGVGAVFQTPLGGALLATEMLYSEPEYESDALVPSLVASIVGYSLFRFMLGGRSIMDLPAGLTFGHPLELLPYAALAVASVLCAWLFVWIHRDFVPKRILAHLPGPSWLYPLWGSVAVVLLIGAQPLLAGPGYAAVQATLDSALPLGLMVALLGGKMLATAFTGGAGAAGGSFAPTIMMGALLGSIVETAAKTLAWPWLPGPGALAVVGLGGFFAAISKVPLAMIVMTAELTGGYALLVPMMLVVAFSYTFAPRRSIHDGQVRNRFASPAHVGSFVVDVLERIRVAEVLVERPLRRVPPQMSLAAIMPLVTGTSQNYFPVVDGDGALTGMFSLDDVRRILGEEGLGELLVAEDLATKRLIVTTPDEGLDVVMRKFTMKNLDELPVVADTESWRFLGMLRRRDVIEAYNRVMYLEGFHRDA
jgi:CIC family chloride channel protein